MLRPLIAIGVLSIGTAALADPTPVDGDSLKKSIPGSLVEIDTPLGTKMPIRFTSDGLISAEAGDLAPILGSAKDRGRWWVDGDKLCSKFFRWFDAEPRCITLSRDGSRLYWRKDDGETGTATLVEQAAPAATVVAKSQPPVSKGEPHKVEAAKIETAASNTKTDAEPAKTAAANAEAPVVSAPKANAEIQTASESASAPAGTPSASPAPVVVASAEASTAAAPAAPQDRPAMTFGGTALMDASSRVGPQGPVRPLDKPSAAKKPVMQSAASAKPDTAKKAPKKETVVAQLPPAARPVNPGSGALSTKAGQAPKAAQASNNASGRAPTASEMFAAAEGAKARDVSVTGSLGPSSRYRVTGVQAGDVLNVRRGPSEEHQQIGGIPPKGRSVEIIGRCYADWCPVRYGKIKGWVNRYYLVAEGAQIGSSSPVYVAKP